MHNSKLSIVILAVSVTILRIMHAEVALGDMGSFAVGLKAGISHTDNITLSSEEISDTVITLEPSLQYKTDEGAASIEASVGVESKQYSELDGNDADNIKSNVRITFPDVRDGENYSLVLEGGYNENTTARSSLQSVIQTEELDLSLDGNYYFDDYTTLRFGIENTDNESQTENFADVNTLSLPFALILELDEAFNAGIGYRYRSTDVESITSEKADSTDHAFYFCFENQPSAVWAYAVKVGLQERQFEEDATFEDEHGLYASFVSKWQFSAMTELQSELANEYGTTLANQSSETAGLTLQLNHKFDERLSASFGLSYEEIEYLQVNGSTREDDRFTSFLNVDYDINGENWFLRAMVGYEDNSSNFDRANYTALSAGIHSVFVY